MKTKEELLGLKYNELLAYAKSLNISGLKKKEDLIEAILKAQEKIEFEKNKEEKPKTTSTSPAQEWKEGDVREFKDGPYRLTKIEEKGVEKLSWKKIKTEQVL